MAFHFPLMPRIFMALRLEDRHPITEIMAQTPPIPATCQWGLFLRNHDELTLEMVTRRRARLHVPGLQRRSADAHQRRHPPAPGAPDGQQPPAHRADEQPAVLVSGHAHHLLRRRDRHGRQHLSRRPQRRPHADAVDGRPQRRLLARQSGEALQPPGHGPGVRLRGDQRGSAAERSVVPAALDAQHDRAAQAVPRLRPGHAGVSGAGEPQGAGLRSPLRRRPDSVRRQPFAFRPAGGARPGIHGGNDSGGDAGVHRVSR